MYQKNPRAHKNKIGTPPLQNPKSPPSKEFYGHEGFPPEKKNQKSQAPIQLTQPFPACPRIAGENFYGYDAFFWV